MSLWSNSPTPAIIDSGDNQAVELGTKFTADVNGQITSKAETLDVDLGLQLGQVAAAAGDDALNVGDAVAQQADRPGQCLEALLVLDAPPGDDQWFGGVTCTNGGGSSRTGPYADCTDAQMMATANPHHQTEREPGAITLPPR